VLIRHQLSTTFYSPRPSEFFFTAKLSPTASPGQIGGNGGNGEQGLLRHGLRRFPSLRHGSVHRSSRSFIPNARGTDRGMHPVSVKRMEPIMISTAGRIGRESAARVRVRHGYEMLPGTCWLADGDLGLMLFLFPVRC